MARHRMARHRMAWLATVSDMSPSMVGAWHAKLPGSSTPALASMPHPFRTLYRSRFADPPPLVSCDFSGDERSAVDITADLLYHSEPLKLETYQDSVFRPASSIYSHPSPNPISTRFPPDAYQAQGSYQTEYEEEEASPQSSPELRAQNHRYVAFSRHAVQIGLAISSSL